MKQILVIEGDLNQSIITFAKKLREQLPTDLQMKNIPLQDLSTLAEQVESQEGKWLPIPILICDNFSG